MQLVETLVLSCGQYRVDDWTRAAMIRAKFRKDGWPDQRTKLGRKWQAYLQDQERKCTEAWGQGKSFTPDRFTDWSC